MMALATNYKRNPTLKEEDRMHLAMARLALREGKTREEYVASVKPGFAKRAGEFYDQAKQIAT
jgi:hypothetical protein